MTRVLSTRVPAKTRRPVFAVRSVLFVAVLSLAAFACAVVAHADDTRREGLDFFERKIRPVLVQHCYECHSAESKSVKGGLLLDTRDSLRQGGDSGPAVVPRSVDESLLISAIRYESYEMPPRGRLDDAIVADFVKWVEMGAPDPRDEASAAARKAIDMASGRDFWSLRPPVRPVPPVVDHAQWPATDIDRFILARLEAEGLRPVAEADRFALLRRVSLDLTGMPPTVREIEAFAADASSDAWRHVVDRLLESPHFGERWGRHWLDVARYGESTGMERNYVYPHAWRYRDYVIDAFNRDKPYDRFLAEQIAGDLLPYDSAEARDEQLIATGFLVLGTKRIIERDREQFLMDVADEQIDVTFRAALGMTVGCARCHDHKFDPVPTADYYALAGIFRSTELYPGARLGKDGNRNRAAEAFPLGPDGKKVLADLVAYQAELGRLQTLLNNLVRERSYRRTNALAAAERMSGKSAASGEALSEDKAASAVAPKTAKAKDDSRADQAAKIKPIESMADGELNSAISDTEDQLEALKGRALPKVELAMAALDADKPVDLAICIRGDVHNLGPAAPRGFVSALTRDGAPSLPSDQSGRLELARWVTSRENPLVARVMVNRVWHHLFGVGIVPTVDDFGRQGQPPSHAELLDYLANRFMDSGWSVKGLVREIVTSRAYRAGAAHDAANHERDPDNRWLWRANRRRLDAEAIRDALLLASGRLALEPPRGSLLSELPDGELDAEGPIRDLQARFDGRSVYLPSPRSAVAESLAMFDAPDPSLVVGRREATTVPTQALFMMNGQIVLDECDRLARRLAAEAGDDATRIDLAYRLVLSRPADRDEIELGRAFLHDFSNALSKNAAATDKTKLVALASFCQALVASGEFRYIP